MKKVLLLLVILLFPAFVFAKENVEIKEATLVEKSDKVGETKPIHFEGLKIDFFLKFVDVEDYAEYKIVVKNNTNTPYEIANAKEFGSGDFIKYEYLSEDNSRIIKANEEKEFFIKIIYQSPVDDNDFVNGVYVENNNMELNLSNEENPKTNTRAMIILLLVLGFVIISIGISSGRKEITYLLLIVWMIPLSIYAYEKLSLTVTAEVEVRQEGTFVIRTVACEERMEHEKTFTFERGMTFAEYDKSVYYLSEDEETQNSLNAFLGKDPEHQLVVYSEDHEYHDCIRDADTVEENEACRQEHYFPFHIEDKIEDQATRIYRIVVMDLSNCPN